MREGARPGVAGLLLVAGLVAAACSSPSVQGLPVSVLMIGNSYSSANNLPAVLANVAEAEGRELSVELVAEGGWSLGDHANSAGTMASIETGSWDFVVLQEQSVIPSFADYREKYMFPAARARFPR